jgi:hypothetical protein
MPEWVFSIFFSVILETRCPVELREGTEARAFLPIRKRLKYAFVPSLKEGF